MRAPRSIVTILAASTLALLAGAAAAQAPLQLPRPSQGASVSQTLGTTTLSVKYSRPGVKGRVIWGGLVPYEKPWRMGANEATQFVTSSDITVEGKALPAGTYALLCIPTATDWTIVFSRQKEMWGAFAYDPAQDQLRVTAKPQAADPVEWMEFAFDVTAPDAADLALRWEKLRVPVRVRVDVNGIVLKDARAAVAAAAADDWRTPYRCAGWAFDNALAPDEASAWAAKALGLKENFQTLSLTAKMSAKSGRSKEAVGQMTKAIQLGKADKDLSAEQIGPMEKLLADWNAGK